MSATLMSAADRAEWLEWRRGGITATDVAKIAGLSPWGSPWSVWADKVGLTPIDDDAPNDAAEFGLRAEQMLAIWFTDRTGHTVTGTQERRQHPEHQWARATLDGTAVTTAGDVIGGVEFKTTADATAAEWRADGVPIHYACQAQWQMFVTGHQRTFMPTLHLAHGRLEFWVHEVDRDDDDIATLATLAESMWRDHIITGIGPDVDSSAATAAALAIAWPNPVNDAVEADDELAGTVAALVALKADAKRLDDLVTLAENRIKAALADRTTITYGVDRKGRPQVIATWKAQARTGFDHTAALERYPRALERYITTTTHRVLRPKTIKEK